MVETINNEKQPETQNLICNDISEKSFIMRGVNLQKEYLSRKLFFLQKSTHLILDNVNINIEKGKIYALLGPSGIRNFLRFFNYKFLIFNYLGCGKTTVKKIKINSYRNANA